MRRLAARGLLRRQPLKQGAIIAPKDHWPRFEGGMSMVPLGAGPDGKLRFAYEYSTVYEVSREQRCVVGWCWGREGVEQGGRARQQRCAGGRWSA